MISNFDENQMLQLFDEVDYGAMDEVNREEGDIRTVSQIFTATDGRGFRLKMEIAVRGPWCEISFGKAKREVVGPITSVSTDHFFSTDLENIRGVSCDLSKKMLQIHKEEVKFDFCIFFEPFIQIKMDRYWKNFDRSFLRPPRVPDRNLIKG